MKRLLVLTPAPFSAASTRYRLSQFFPLLQANGIEPILRPFLDEAGFRVLYRPGHAVEKIRAALRALAGRTLDLARALGANAVLLHREAALIGPPLIESGIVNLLRRPLLFDLDDAIWVPYESPTYGLHLSRLLKRPGKTDYTMARANHVIAGNTHIAERAKQFHSRVTIIPTVVDTDVFIPRPDRIGSVPVIGWIGTHSSLPYLQALVPVLRRLASRRTFILRVVGATLNAPGLRIEHFPWSLDREVADFQSLDIGLYPLLKNAWSMGKSGFKAIQYMACGVPVVASPVGVTTEIVHPGENGYLATSSEEWLEYLTKLLDDIALRRRLGARGRMDVLQSWSLASQTPRFLSIIKSMTT